MKCRFVLLPVLMAALLLGQLAAAQETGPIPHNDEAELVFREAVDLFEGGDYEEAYRRFRVVADDFQLNRRTTAALLMAGKALYRSGAYERAEDVLTELIQGFPTSRYLEEARRTRQFARQQQEGRAGPVLQIGVLLPPAEGNTAMQTQALFNGIRLAVDEANASGERAVRIVYRETGGVSGARRAANALVQEGVDVMIGPLFSDEAVAAGQIAEENGVVMMAPLATDPAVSQNRQYVFQANPTLAMRGRQMARFTANSLITVDAVGVVVEAGSRTSEQLGRSFQQELQRLGEEPVFYERLSGSSGWRNLPDFVSAERLEGVDAVYMPVAGSNAGELVSAALSGIDRIGARVRILGNSAWHDVPVRQLAGQYNTTYAAEFYARSGSAAQAFSRRYEELTGSALSEGVIKRLAFTGYDVTRYLLSTLTGTTRGQLHEALRERPPFEGVGVRLDFASGNVNEALFYLRYRTGSIELLR